MGVTRRTFLTAGASAALLSPAKAAKRGAAPVARPQVLNDASRLNPVPVALNHIVRTNDEQRVIADLRGLLKEAASENRPVCFGGARHSMGGQSLVRDGFCASFAQPSIAPNVAAQTYRAGAGT